MNSKTSQTNKPKIPPTQTTPPDNTHSYIITPEYKYIEITYPTE